MRIHLPSQIIIKRLGEDARRFTGIHYYVMFKPVAAYILHQALQIIYLRHVAVTKGVQRIIGKLTFAYIRFYYTQTIISSYSAISTRPCGRTAFQAAIAIYEPS